MISTSIRVQDAARVAGFLMVMVASGCTTARNHNISIEHGDGGQTVDATVDRATDTGHDAGRGQDTGNDAGGVCGAGTLWP